MHKQIVKQKLEAIVDAIDIIKQRTQSFATVHDMLSDYYGSIVFDACVMRLQTIGENVKSIDDRTGGTYLAKYPNTPWYQIIGLRNIISHEYANIDPEVIWSVISNHLDSLRDEITRMKSELESE